MPMILVLLLSVTALFLALVLVLRAPFGFIARRIWVSYRPRPGAAPRVPYDLEAMGRNPSLTWIGHSTFLVTMEGVTFITDPMFSKRASPFSFMGPRRMVPPGVPLDVLPKLDFVLLSHDHYDHADLATVRTLARRGVRFIVPRGLAEWVRRAGGEALELEWWQHAEIGGVQIHCVPAQHFSGRTPWDRNRRLWAGFVVIGASRRFYYAGDSGYTPLFAEIGTRLGPMDLALVPIGAYEPAVMMRPVHTTPEEAVRAAVDVGAKCMVATHWGTFDLADEQVDEPPRRFRAEAARVGVGAERAWVLGVGETRGW